MPRIEVRNYLNSKSNDLEEGNKYSITYINEENLICESANFYIDDRYNFYMKSYDQKYVTNIKVKYHILIFIFSLLTNLYIGYKWLFDRNFTILNFVFQILLLIIFNIYLITIIFLFSCSENNCYINITNSNIKNKLIKILFMLAILFVIFLYYLAFI